MKASARKNKSHGYKALIVHRGGNIETLARYFALSRAGNESITGSRDFPTREEALAYAQGVIDHRETPRVGEVRWLSNGSGGFILQQFWITGVWRPVPITSMTGINIDPLTTIVLRGSASSRSRGVTPAGPGFTLEPPLPSMTVIEIP